MSLVRIDWRPDTRQRRTFGVTMLAGFGIIAALAYFKGNAGVAAGCLVYGGVAGLLGIFGTRAVLPFYWLWMAAAFVMGSIMSRVILSALYYGLLTPIALAMRACGRDRLGLNKRDASSYWVDVSEDTGDYERQF